MRESAIWNAHRLAETNCSVSAEFRKHGVKLLVVGIAFLTLFGIMLLTTYDELYPSKTAYVLFLICSALLIMGVASLIKGRGAFISSRTCGDYIDHEVEALARALGLASEELLKLDFKTICQKAGMRKIVLTTEIARANAVLRWAKKTPGVIIVQTVEDWVERDVTRNKERLEDLETLMTDFNLHQ